MFYIYWQEQFNTLYQNKKYIYWKLEKIKIVLAFWILEIDVRGYNNTSEAKCDKLLPILAIIVKASRIKDCWFLGGKPI